MRKMKSGEGRRESRLQQFVMYLILLAGVVPILLPLYWLVLGSLKTRDRLEASPPDWLPVVPRNFIQIEGRDVEVVIVDDGKTPGTGGCRVRAVRSETGLIYLPVHRVRRATGETSSTPVIPNEVRNLAWTVEILGQTQVVEPIQMPLLDDPNTVVAVRVPGLIAITPDRIRSEAPLRPQWHNYVVTLQDQTFNLYAVNTLFIGCLVVLGTILSCGLVGYAFARLQFRGRDALFLLLLATLMVPAQVTSIPTFVLFVKFGWIDSFKPLIAPSFFAQTAFFVFLFRQFMLTVPADLEDAARIDGCGPLATWWLVLMPLSRPIVVTVAVFSFLGVWNDLLGPLLYINSDAKQTVALGLQNLKSSFYGGQQSEIIMAASVMAMLPSLLLFFIAQRAFLRGVVVSGVKG